MSLVAGIVVACGGSDGNPLLDGGNNNDGGNGNDGQASDGQSGDVSVDGSDGSMCPSFCGGIKGALFCSDFDQEATPADWTQTTTTNGGAVAITQAEETSCPNGLHVSLPQIMQGGLVGGSAKVSKTITTVQTLSHVVVKLEAFLPSNDMMSYVVFFGVHPVGDPNGGIYVTHHGDAFWFLSNQNGTNIAINPSPLTGAWNAMTLDVNFGNPGAIKLTYTGADNATHTTTGNANAPINGVGGVTVEAGMVATGTTEAAFDAYYDSVILQPGN
jgi:hypothetical protein